MSTAAHGAGRNGDAKVEDQRHQERRGDHRHAPRYGRSVGPTDPVGRQPGHADQRREDADRSPLMGPPVERAGGDEPETGSQVEDGRARRRRRIAPRLERRGRRQWRRTAPRTRRRARSADQGGTVPRRGGGPADTTVPAGPSPVRHAQPPLSEVSSSSPDAVASSILVYGSIVNSPNGPSVVKVNVSPSTDQSM